MPLTSDYRACRGELSRHFKGQKHEQVSYRTSPIAETGPTSPVSGGYSEIASRLARLTRGCYTPPAMSQTDENPIIPPASGIDARGTAEAARGEESSLRRGIASTALLITLGNLTSRLLGLLREGVIAGLFGKTAQTSAFATAASVPQMLYDLVIGGAVSAALIPVFSKYARPDLTTGESGKSDKSNGLGELVGTVGLIALLVTAVSALVLGAFAEPLVSFLGVSEGPIHAETSLYVRLILPSVVFLGLSSVITALLYATGRVVFPAFAVASYNAGIIIGAILLSGTLGPLSLVLGVVLGAFGQFVLQLFGLRGLGLRFGLNLAHPAIKTILRLYAPVGLGLVISQVGVIVDRNLAWRTGEDSIAIMRFATTLIQLPLGLVATATSMAILPSLTRSAEDGGELLGFKRMLALGIRLATLAIAPAFLALVILPDNLVRLLFERGAFDQAATQATALAVLYYAPQLPFVALDQLLIFAFYARKDTLTPALIGLLGVGVYLASGVYLSGLFPVPFLSQITGGWSGLGVYGLVLANTLQNSLHALILLFLLSRAIGPLGSTGLGGFGLRVLMAAFASGAILYLFRPFIPTSGGLIPQVISIGLALTLFLGAYLLFLWRLKVEEIGDLGRLIERKLKR